MAIDRTSSLLTDLFTEYLASEFYWMDEGFIKHFLDYLSKQIGI